MKKVSIEDRKKVQMDMLQAIHEFCMEHHLKYSLVYGSLLGAIRHHGFIPWDDDIDIALLRKDYEYLVKNFHVKDKEYYKLHELRTDKYYVYPFAKITDERTVFFQKGVNARPMGIFIDVFPIDNLFNTKKESISYLRNLHLFVKKCFSIKLLTIRQQRLFARKVALCIGKIFLVFFPIRFFAKLITKSALRNNDFNSKYVGLICDGFRNFESVTERSDYENLIEVPFEGHKFWGIKLYDKYLKNIYGDYMTPPKNPLNHGIEENAYWKDL